MKNRLFLDVHVIQTLPPANINRDDTGSPKTAQYGGVTRSRVSSQSWKKAVRAYFNEHGNLENQGVRSRNLVKFIADKIIDLDPSKSEEEAMKLAEESLNKAKISTKDGKVKALFFISDKQAENFAKASLDGIKDKKILQEILNDNPSIDICLFGRMVADDPTLNEDASCQFAHAISTHPIEREFDFYTAVDDLAPDDNSGAGMLGTIEYNSSTVYRYANIGLHEFRNQLGDDDAFAYAVGLFIEGFFKSMPTGKINTFANQTLPSAIVLSLRTDRPLNLITAFEKPIRSNDGYVEKSIIKLSDEYEKYNKILEKPIYSSYLIIDDDEFSNFGKKEESLESLIENLKVSLIEYLK